MMMAYQYGATDTGTPRQDGIQLTSAAGATWVPADAENTDWQAYLAWLAAGNTPAVSGWVAPPPTVSGDALIGALTKAQAAQCDVRDLVRIVRNDTVPANNPKLGRIATAAGTTTAALMQAAKAS